jgi:tetratricopeptide (TPR) repeat protein
MQDPQSSVFPSASVRTEGARIDTIIARCEHVLAGNPDHSGALQLLGTIYLQQGKAERALPLLRHALALMPESAEGFRNLGLILRKTGHPDDAIAAFRRAIAICPDDRVALTNLGNALAARGDHAGAIAQYRALLTLDAQEATIETCRAALAIDAADVAALNSLGAALRSIGRREEAVAQFQAALTHAPDFVEAAMNLGALLTELERIEDAIACYQSILDRDPNNYGARTHVGKLLHDNGRYRHALDHLEQARALRPDDASAHANFGKILQEVGQIEAATGCFRRAIALAPDRPQYYLSLTRITKLAVDDPALIAMQALADNEGSLTDGERMDLHFSLGQALYDAGQKQVSFEHTLRANALRRRYTTYDENRAFTGMQSTREHFSADAIESLARTGHTSACPIFIVGMPRSGSTLVEQILASHPDVYGAGEVSTLMDTFQDAASRFPAWKTIAPLPYLTEAERQSIADDYLQRLNRLVIDWTGDGPPARISNKTLGNYIYIGLIRQLWPNARIIHTFRDPIDTCLSCFSIPFTAQDFTFDLGELGRRYRDYRDLMDHWRRVLPAGAMLEVRYEDVVDDLEANARRIVAYCGLRWDDACLRFYESGRPVKTSSMEQVRKPIYRSSVGRWRPDDETLRPLLEALASRTHD